jgi:hypothetical protein
VRPSLIDEQACIDHVIQVVSGRREPLQKRDPAEPLVTGAPSLSVVSGSVEEPAEEGLSADGGDSGPLTEEELHRGALIGRVEMRVAGGMRLVPRPLMRSSDDPDQYVLAQRGGVTNQLQPVLRNGAPRLVKRSSSGTWQILTNA